MCDVEEPCGCSRYLPPPPPPPPPPPHTHTLQLQQHVEELQQETKALRTQQAGSDEVVAHLQNEREQHKTSMRKVQEDSRHKQVEVSQLQVRSSREQCARVSILPV